MTWFITAKIKDIVVFIHEAFRKCCKCYNLEKSLELHAVPELSVQLLDIVLLVQDGGHVVRGAVVSVDRAVGRARAGTAGGRSRRERVSIWRTAIFVGSQVQGKIYDP